MSVPPTIVHNLARGRIRFADRTLLIDGHRAVSYAEFAELVEGAADRLAAAGLERGDRLAVCLRNGLDIAVAIWACARGGFIFVGLPTNLDPPAWAALLDHARPSLLLAGDEFLPGLPATARPVGDDLTGQHLPWRVDAPLPGPEEVYAVIYTSGTTGRPKAATVTHRAAMTVAGFYTDLLRLTSADVTAIHLPFSYVSGHLSQLNPFLLAGGSAVTMPRFSAAELIRVLHEHRVSVIDVVPSIFAMLLRDPRFSPAQLPALRTAIFGGAPMPLSTVQSLRARMPGLELFNIYGMTETAGIIAALHDIDLDAHPGSVGKQVPHADIRVAGDGELLVRGPMVTAGYWSDRSATDQAITDGWLHTGDVARLDDAGFLYVGDRIKDLIIRGGVKISAADVEHALTTHPAVAEAAAFGVPDGMAGEAVAACIVPAENAGIDIRELKAWVRGRLPVHARPRILRTVTELPRGRTGKVDKNALRAVIDP